MNFEITFKQPADEFYDENTSAKVRKFAEYLGPWCPNCGKRGTTCTGRSVSGCKARALKTALKGCDVKRLTLLTLPRPSEDWIAKRYGSQSTSYYHGGRWRSDPLGRARLPNWVDPRDAAQEYAYEVAIGRADAAEDVAA